MKTTEENNKLISEFMGATKTKFNERVVLSFDYNFLQVKLAQTMDCFEEGVKFNTSWDWLMPVVEKIEDFQDGEIEDAMRRHLFNVNIEQCFVEIINMETSESICQVDGDNKMDATYNAVVEFIKWYNENK